MHSIDAILVNKGGGAGEHLSNHYCKRKYIGAMIYPMAQQLFWRHVIYCSEESSRFGFDSPNKSLLFTVRGNQGPVALGYEFGQTKIEDFCVTILAEHEVFWFQIAMNDSKLMSL